jgi:hypothetical protein
MLLIAALSIVGGLLVGAVFELLVRMARLGW